VELLTEVIEIEHEDAPLGKSVSVFFRGKNGHRFARIGGVFRFV
jgi:hypothetical protein